VRRLRPRSGRRLEALADEELIARAREGDEAAFALIYERHGLAAFSLAYRIVGRRGAAETVVQEAFLSLWRHAQRYDPARAGLRAFLLGIVRHRAIDALRRSAVHESRRAGDEGAAERLAAEQRTDAEVMRRDGAAHVRRALADLPADQQRVIELAYFGGFTQSEIASMLGAPLGTVKGRMRLGLEKLRATLDEGVAEAWA
jgi:RNA polymerase sigma-70 factor, ECF subfamily